MLAASDPKSSDALGRRVQNSIASLGYSEHAKVHCESEGATVFLSGNLSSYYLTQIAQAIAMKVPGVAKVVNEIHVDECSQSSTGNEPDAASVTSHLHKERRMNWDQIEGRWKQAKGQAQQKWGELTSDDLDVIDGKREELVGKVQERYGIAKEEAEKQVAEFEATCSC